MTKWNGLERTEIKRGTLRSWNSSIPSKSAKRKRMASRVKYVNGDPVAENFTPPQNRKRKPTPYAKFSRRLREERPNCELRATGCTGRTEGVHHVIKQSQGGAKRPGPLAEAQGQVFMAACNRCNGWVEDNPKEARERGWTKSNPLRGVKFYA